MELESDQVMVKIETLAENLPEEQENSDDVSDNTGKTDRMLAALFGYLVLTQFLSQVTATRRHRRDLFFGL